MGRIILYNGSAGPLTFNTYGAGDWSYKVEYKKLTFPSQNGGEVVVTGTGEGNRKDKGVHILLTDGTKFEPPENAFLKILDGPNGTYGGIYMTDIERDNYISSGGGLQARAQIGNSTGETLAVTSYELRNLKLVSMKTYTLNPVGSPDKKDRDFVWGKGLGIVLISLPNKQTFAIEDESHVLINKLSNGTYELIKGDPAN